MEGEQDGVVWECHLADVVRRKEVGRGGQVWLPTLTGDCEQHAVFSAANSDWRCFPHNACRLLHDRLLDNPQWQHLYVQRRLIYYIEGRCSAKLLTIEGVEEASCCACSGRPLFSSSRLSPCLSAAAAW